MPIIITKFRLASHRLPENFVQFFLQRFGLSEVGFEFVVDEWSLAL